MTPRHWCARCQYPGRAEFLIGTVQAEGHEDARAGRGGGG